MANEIRVPALGESVTEATVGRWFKKAGEPVKADEPIVELETDKVTLEVNAPVSGVLTYIGAKGASGWRRDIARSDRGRRVRRASGAEAKPLRRRRRR